jgi:hypothetical protein
MKTLLTDYDKLMKDNQSKIQYFIFSFLLFYFSLELLARHKETKTILNEFEKKSQSSLKPTANEFPNPQRVQLPCTLIV